MAMADARSASGLGSGGMVSKLQAAKIATHAGAHLAIISGKIERPLTAFATTGRGTVFVAPPKASAKKRSEEHTSELQSLMRTSYAVFCLKKKKNKRTTPKRNDQER